MAGLFTKAKDKAATKSPAKSKKETTWLVGDTDETKKLGVAVTELVKLNRESKTIEAKMGVFKSILKDFGETNYVKGYVALEVPPETPMNIQNSEGEKVTFVIQDRSSQYGVKDDQREALVELLGEDKTGELLYEETTFGFSREVLALPGVMAIVEKALESASKKLVEQGVVNQEVVDGLLEVKTKTAFKPGTLDKLVMICGRDVPRVSAFLEIMGSSATRYVKA